ncbi:MAG: phosphoribosyltransferase [Gemmatimonadaceae bacterium]
MLHLFEDRADAGRQLAAQLMGYAAHPGVIVLGLPRGGVPVAFEVATALGVPLDVFMARKLGVPGHAEIAMGAVATGSVCVLNEEIVRAFGVSRDTVRAKVAAAELEVRACDQRYRGRRPPVDVHGSTVILVDDGIATGATVRAALSALRAQFAKRIVVATPVAAFDRLVVIEHLADEVVVLEMPARFHSVGAWYRTFPQVSESEVRDLLERAAGELPEEMRIAAHVRESVA